ARASFTHPHVDTPPRAVNRLGIRLHKPKCIALRAQVLNTPSYHILPGARANKATRERASARYVEPVTDRAVSHETISLGASKLVSIQRRHGTPLNGLSGGNSKSSGAQ